MDYSIQYHHHSGVSVAINGQLFVFDYWRGEHHELTPEATLTVEKLQAYDKVFVFVSHAHQDHYDPIIDEWRIAGNVTYVVSADMPVGTRGKRMSPGDAAQLTDRVSVRAYDSTDLGVSFAVTADGLTIFHAGDLNFWHWREESTPHEIEEAERAFYTALEPIKREKIDLAFFPVDPRQGEMYDAGVNTMMLSLKPRLLIPIHFWGRGDLIEDFCRRSRSKNTETFAMVHVGDRLNVHVGEDGAMNAVFQPAALPEVADAAERGSFRDGVSNPAEDPFQDTYMPVQLDELKPKEEPPTDEENEQ